MKFLFCVLGTVLCALSTNAFPRPKQHVPPQCIDPTFACQDLQSARLCDTVSPCIHDVWATMTAPDSNDEVCDICKEMVKEARDQLLSNMTQEEIKEVFEGSCKLLPVKLIADGCIKVVDEIIPELVEMLASRMDPTMVCTVSGMCFATSETLVAKFLKLISSYNKDNDECSECTTMMTDMKTFLHTASESEVKTYIANFCHEKMPSYLCRVIVNSYFPSLYNYLMSTDSKSLCSSVGVCPKLCNPREVTNFNDELTCEFCEHVLQHMKDLITANTTAEEFKTALLNFCNHTGKFSDKCTAIVNDYYDMMFDYIRGLDTKGMCTLMGLCNKSAKCSSMPLIKLIPAEEAQKRVPMMKFKPDHVSNYYHPSIKVIPANVASKKDIETNDIFPSPLPVDRFFRPLAIFQKDTECAFCKAISFFLEKELKQDRSEEGVEVALKNVCERWVTDFPKECDQFINKHSEKIQHAIVNGVQLDDMCLYSKVCESEDGKSEIGVRILPKTKAGPFCNLCKDTMTEVENTLSDPATKQILKDTLDQACNCRFLPMSLRNDCKTIINTNIDAIIDILEQELKPNNFCPALRLCDVKSRIQVSERVKDVECDVCKQVVSSLRQKLSDPNSKKIVLTLLEEGCARLPESLSQECKSFVDENIDTIIGIIIQELDPDTFCSILKMCKATVKVEEPRKVKSLECVLCVEVVSKVEDLVKNNKTVEEIKVAVEKVCSLLPSHLAAECVKFVDTYIDTLITLCMIELSPELICATMHLCPASIKVEKPRQVNDVECDLCKQVLQKVEDMVKDQKTEEQIQSALDKVCSYMPSSLSVKCKNFVDTYTKTLITLLMAEMDPEMICSALKLCPASIKVEKARQVKDVECDLCKQVVQKVEDMVKDQKTEEQIQSALDKVCSYMPSSLSVKCKNFIDTYTKTVITLIMAEMDPDMICAALKLCPDNAQFPAWQSKAVDLECQGCQYGLHYLQELLTKPDTQEELKNLMKKMCDVLPATYAKNCNAFVDEYGSSLLVLFAQEIDPSTLCWELKICNNQPKIFEKNSILHPFNNDECSVCANIVDYVDKLLEEDDVDTEITKLVEKVCTVLPSSYGQTCTTTLETYGPYILQMIGQLADSKQVCQEIDMCARPPGHVHLLGGNKCTFGPSYWCKTSAHASACKAEAFCKDKFWNN